MTAHVVLAESVVLKRFSSTTAATAALDRAEALQAAGIATPLPIRENDRTLRFPRIKGTTGPDLIARLPDLLSPLLGLNRLRLPSLGLPQHDPLRRIRPRLALAPPPVASLVLEQVPLLPEGTDRVCHGDFHPGQVIHDAEGRSWLLDLDDLALGPVEADLGNLIAWLASQPLRAPRPLTDRLVDSRATLVAAWTGLGGRTDPAILAPYMTLALIRRALKRAESGDTSLLDELAAAT